MPLADAGVLIHDVHSAADIQILVGGATALAVLVFFFALALSDEDNRAPYVTVAILAILSAFVGAGALPHLGDAAADEREANIEATVRDLEEFYEVRIQGELPGRPQSTRYTDSRVVRQAVHVRLPDGASGDVDIVYRDERIYLVGVEELKREVSRTNALTEDDDPASADELRPDREHGPDRGNGEGGLERLADVTVGPHSPLGRLLGGNDGP